MNKTGPELRHDAKQRMERYRAQMIEKGYTSTTIFLSHEHRAELKRLGDEHKLTRAESAEHIFQVYLQSENKNVTQISNINTADQTETRAIIEALEARVKALENQAISRSDIMPETEDDDSLVLELEIELDDSEDKNITQTNNTNTEPQVESTDRPIQESQIEMFDTMPEPVEPKPDQNTELPDYLINVNPDMPIEERHKIILRLAENFPGRQNAQKRIDLLNAAGVLLGGKPWETTKQFGDQVSIARRWVKKNEKA